MIIKKNKLDKACFEHDIAWYVTEHLILLKVQNMMNIKKVFLQWSRYFLIKSLLVMLLQVPLQKPQLREINLLLKVKLYQTNDLLKNYTSQLLGNLKNVKYTHLLKTFWGASKLSMYYFSQVIMPSVVLPLCKFTATTTNMIYTFIYFSTHFT